MKSAAGSTGLDVEDLPGTLLYLGFSRARRCCKAPIAMRLADELRDIVRPTDLLGRINSTTIALWCDGMDHLTGGERAAKFCPQLPAILPERTLITVGVASRWPGSGDDPATVIEHAGVALRLAEIATERTTGADKRRLAGLAAGVARNFVWRAASAPNSESNACMVHAFANL